MKRMKISGLILIAVVLFPLRAGAHCEIPCGIYDDVTRMKLIMEHIATIERSMQQINQLEGNQEVNNNQLIRWVNNKEKHATELQDIATQYFMFQRIKINAAGELSEQHAKLLAHLHQLCVYAMKCKQGCDINQVAKLREAAKNFAEGYFDKHQLEHLGM